MVLLTLLATAAAAFVAMLLLGAAATDCLGASGPCGPGWGITVLAFVPALAILVGGLSWARGAGAVGHRGLRERFSVSARPVPPQVMARPVRPPVKRRRGGDR